MDRVLASVFLLLLLLPGASWLALGPDVEDIRQEGRMPEPFPAVHAAAILDGSFSDGFEDWFSDAQGARTALITARNRLWWFGFGLSPSKDMERGRGGWIFTTKRSSIPVFRGLMPLTLQELEQLRSYIERRLAWLRERGMVGLVVVAPSKHSIYPGRLPERLTRHGPTRLDQLLEHMRARSWAPLHDFREVLIAETAADRPEVGDFTYHPLGTHWTDRGARAASREIVTRLAALLAPRFPDLRPPADDRFVTERVAGPGDSLAERLHLADHLTQAVWSVKARPARARMTGTADLARHLEVPDASLPDAVVIHDSFGFALWPILAESFRRSTFLSVLAAADERVTDADPDVVVLVIAERNLMGLPDFWPLDGRAPVPEPAGN